MGIWWPLPSTSAEKSPCRNASVGTVTTLRLILPPRRRKLSYATKKNVRFLITGPPTVPPNSFWRTIGLAEAKNPRASSLSFRRNSNTSPWYWFVPDFNV